MLKKLLLFALLMVGMTSAVFADETGRQTYKSYHTVDHAEIVREDDSYVLVIRGDLPDGCDFPIITETQQVDRTLFVDMYREMPFDVMCPMVVVPYEIRIPADMLFGEDGVTMLIINTTIFSVEHDEIRATTELRSEGWIRMELAYETLTVTRTEAKDVAIRITGATPDTCHVPIYRLVADNEKAGYLMVELYSALPVFAMCLGTPVPFDLTLTVPAGMTVRGISLPLDS